MDGSIGEQLEAGASADDFPFRSRELAAAWLGEGIGAEAVDTVLRFMERHPDIDFGAPGALVHFVERFDGPEYEQSLVNSVRRSPTPHTIWMLNRVINGRQSPEWKARLLAVMAEARFHPLATVETARAIDSFLPER
jgi:hypothetical protein